MTSHNPADAGNADEVLNRSSQFRILLAEAPDLSLGPAGLQLGKLQMGHHTMQLEADRGRTLQAGQLLQHFAGPLRVGGSFRKGDPFKQQQGLDPTLSRGHLSDKAIAQLDQVA